MSINNKMSNKNSEKAKQYRKEYYELHKEKMKQQMKIYYDLNKDNIKIRTSQIGYQRRTRYGITIEQQKELFQNQNGECAICFVDLDFNKCHLDHDHLTGKIRNFLCKYCNHLLGECKEDLLILQLAIVYLKKHKK